MYGTLFLKIKLFCDDHKRIKVEQGDLFLVQWMLSRCCTTFLKSADIMIGATKHAPMLESRSAAAASLLSAGASDAPIDADTVDSGPTLVALVHSNREIDALYVTFHRSSNLFPHADGLLGARSGPGSWTPCAINARHAARPRLANVLSLLP